ncbi:MAG: diguanylate cyclase [Chloroflexi bacterium]|nr:diguanylate cyclase [Chloroflexota bacterium]
MSSKPNSEIHILLADADARLRAAARRALERMGFTVEPVADGADALARFSPAEFDVVITAILMPRRDGLEVLREIRAISPETQIILIAEPASIGSAALGLRDGAFAYLLRPLEDLRLLTHTVERAVELQQLRRLAAKGETDHAQIPVEPLPLVAARDTDEPAAWAALRGLTDSICAGKPLSATLEALMQSSAALFDASHAVVLLSHAPVGLQLYAAHGYTDTSAAASDYVQSIGDAFAWRVATERKTLQDATSTSRFIGTPLLARDQLRGVLVVYPIRQLTMRPDHVALFESLAAQGAIALEMARLADENERLSPTDPLTLTLKRAAFLEIADREFRRSWRFDQALAAIVLDIDGMGEINRKYGRPFGDDVLQRVAGACRSTVRAFDLLARYEEDALAVLLIMTDHAGARGAAERLRVAVSSLDLADASGPVRVTASFGACAYPREGCASVYDLLDLAQTAQRAARRGGPNQIEFA